jgi:hypothetical protein
MGRENAGVRFFVVIAREGGQSSTPKPLESSTAISESSPAFSGDESGVCRCWIEVQGFPRHCERSEAIQGHVKVLDCFASLAMTAIVAIARG